MNKTAIRNFAIWARNRLIAEVCDRARLAGILSTGIQPPLKQSDASTQYFDIGLREPAVLKGEENISRRSALAKRLRSLAGNVGYERAYNQLMEEIAYTWFNRLIAIRFMEVNDYLPGRVRILSSIYPGKAEPDMVAEPFDCGLELTPEECDEINFMQEHNQLDELFRFLLIRQCEALGEILPMLFRRREKSLGQEAQDYETLLLSLSFTDQEGLVWRLVHDIPELDFRVRTAEDELHLRAGGAAEEALPAGQVQIIGWLYQYYNTEPKDAVFANLKKNIKIEAKDIPAATQLFTPDWIVRYMVENSLGRLWLEGHPSEALRANWRYYLDEAQQEPPVQAQLDELRAGYAKLRPEEIRVIDPCCGSGHIAVYMFDVLMQIYESQGWARRDAVRSILENNLYALDIDRRAAQLAYFAVMMKAREYDRRLLTSGDVPRPHVHCIEQSGTIPEAALAKLGAAGPLAVRLAADFAEANTLGSIIRPSLTSGELAAIREALAQGDLSDAALLRELDALLAQSEILSRRYDAVVTNPPYMGASGMGGTLSKFVKENYPDSKSDLFAVFIERALQMVNERGFTSMITMESWMFLSSFEKLRIKINQNNTIMTLVHMPYLGKGGTSLGINFGTDMAVLSKTHIPAYIGTYDRIAYYETNDEGVPFEFPTRNEYFKQSNQDNFAKIPGAPVAYWVSDNFANVFDGKILIENYSYPKQGLHTCDNERYLRQWYEVSNHKVMLDNSDVWDYSKVWAKLNKGGAFRKWYGNRNFIVYWFNNGEEIKTNGRSIGGNNPYFLKNMVGFTDLTTYKPSFRYYGKGFVFDVSGPSMFINDAPYTINYVLGLMNSIVAERILDVLSPTMHFNQTAIGRISIKRKIDNNRCIEELVDDCISLSRADWDAFETSWDFQRHPLVGAFESVEAAFEDWRRVCDERFARLKANEEELNRIFIDIYGLQDELTPEVEDKDVTVRRADLGRDIRSLISYAVGCMFGRYSLDAPGLAFAGGEWDAGSCAAFPPAPRNCIPITDEAYFDDDIVDRFCAFLRAAYGAKSLERNLDFIAAALGNRGVTSREVIRNYFLNDFYKDHLKVYQKRPIYWLFDSGRQNGFKALIYLHRYDRDTPGVVRAHYLHPLQRTYEREIARMQETIDSVPNAREVANATRRRQKLQKQLAETREYDPRLAHAALTRPALDLDDGVKQNYEILQRGPDGKSLNILARIQ